MRHHTNDPVCPLCEEKLATADPRIADWFREIKKQFPDVHISWAYRGKEDQDKMFAEGKSRAKFPRSKQNVECEAKPCSQALDLFQLKDRKAAFAPKFYFAINEYSKSLERSIKWGGEFKTLTDGDHFEISEV